MELRRSDLLVVETLLDLLDWPSTPESGSVANCPLPRLLHEAQTPWAFTPSILGGVRLWDLVRGIVSFCVQ